jgi:hypothetical protein
MAEKEDLRLRYMIANKEPVTADMLETLLLRAFASSFCGEQTDNMTATIIAQLSGCLCSIRLAEAYDDEDDTEESAVEAKILHGPEAEKFYCNEVIRLYKENGADQLYAEEAASWPDVLAMDNDYMEDTLRQFASLEVGHDLLVGDYLRATAVATAKERKRGSAK